MCLDGELWIGRGLFEYTSGICRALRQDEWKMVKFMIFDAPTTGDAPVEERWERITAHFRTVQSAGLDGLETWGHYMLAHEKCTGQEHLDTTLQRVLDQGGEGYVRPALAALTAALCCGNRAPGTSLGAVGRCTSSSRRWTARRA